MDVIAADCRRRSREPPPPAGNCPAIMKKARASLMHAGREPEGHVDVLVGWPGGDLAATLRLVGLVVFSYAFVLWVASVLWAYKDIRSRTRDPIAQGVGVMIALLFPLVGLPVYLVLRPDETLAGAYARQLEQEAILSDLHAISSCPNCRRPVQDEFQVCAHCGTPLRQPCVRCGKLLQFAWRHCPYCATPREVARAPRTPIGASAPPATRPRGDRQPPRAARATTPQHASAEDAPDLDPPATPRPRTTRAPEDLGGS
jgi:hypothetical protein